LSKLQCSLFTQTKEQKAALLPANPTARENQVSANVTREGEEIQL
jgi:hypothetical protein